MGEMRMKVAILIRLALYSVVAWLAAACVGLESLPKAFAPSYAPMGVMPYVVAALVLAAGAAWVTSRAKHLLVRVLIYMAIGAVIGMVAAPVTSQSYESTMDAFRRSPLSFRPSWLIGGALVGGRGVPAFWPVFCMAYDVVAAACLAALILWRGKATASPPP